MSEYVDLGKIAKMSMRQRLEAWKARKKAQQQPPTSKRLSGEKFSSGGSKELYKRATEASMAFESAVVVQSGAISADGEQNRDPNSTKTAGRRRSSELKQQSGGSVLEVLGSNSKEQQPRKRRTSVGGGGDKETKDDKTRRRRSSEGGRKKKLSSGSRTSLETGIKGTTTKTHASPISSASASTSEQSSSSEALEVAYREISRLNEALKLSEERADAATKKSRDLEEQMEATWSEIKSQFFLNGVHEQEISALHGDIASTQLDKSEEVREARRKLKAEKKALQSENAQLRAMGTELADQMENLQQMFTSRQADLEAELEQKQHELSDMSKLVSAMKLREVESKIKLASAERQVVEINARRASNCSTGSSEEEGGDGYETE